MEFHDIVLNMITLINDKFYNNLLFQNKGLVYHLINPLSFALPDLTLSFLVVLSKITMNVPELR
jgi:hypothetical protein